MTCELGNKPGVTWGVCDPDDCPACGWERREMERRKAAIRAGGATLDKSTGKYCLKLKNRMEKNNAGHGEGG
ncbi:MAG: hypothetical protein LUG45_05320 [Clostridiales bacterium]|nr:hypothetical protein [Clostridiales bacterium]